MRHSSVILHLLINDFLGFCCRRRELQPVLHQLHANKEAATPAGRDAIQLIISDAKDPIHLC